MAISNPRAWFVTSVANFRTIFRERLRPKLRQAHGGPRRFAPRANPAGAWFAAAREAIQSVV
jgi:hypothetical protein